MQPTTADLQAAFNRSKLPALGYSFQSAIACVALKICLNRLAHQQATPLPAPKALRHFWYQDI